MKYFINQFFFKLINIKINILILIFLINNNLCLLLINIISLLTEIKQINKYFLFYIYI